MPRAATRVRRLSPAAALPLVAALGCTSPPAQGGSAPAPWPAPAPRSMSVTGTADLKTTPDELTISAGVDTFAADAQGAKRANDEAMRGLLAATQAAQVDPKDVRTEGFTLQPRHEGPYETRRLVGYDAHKTIVVVLHDSEKVEALLTELFKSGANRLDGITYGSSKLLELRKKARTMAVTAAREKAEAMAASLGQKVGRPLRVDEGGSGSGRFFGNDNNLSSNVSSNNEAGGIAGETMAPGKVEIRASVSVVFELED